MADNWKKKPGFYWAWRLNMDDVPEPTIIESLGNGLLCGIEGDGSTDAKDFVFIEDEPIAPPSFDEGIERELQAATAEVKAWPKWKQDMMRQVMLQK